MSYIRSLSNPEGLYIWHDVDGTVHILHSVPPPLSSKWPRVHGVRAVGKKLVQTRRMVDFPPEIIVPYRAFRDTCSRWASGFDAEGLPHRVSRAPVLR
jgi:hypothetical protein